MLLVLFYVQSVVHIVEQIADFFAYCSHWHTLLLDLLNVCKTVFIQDTPGRQSWDCELSSSVVLNLDGAKGLFVLRNGNLPISCPLAESYILGQTRSFYI